MLNQGGIKKDVYTQPTQILADAQLFYSIPCIVKNDVTSKAVDGRKIVLAGMPLSGNLLDRKTAMGEASADGTTKAPVGVLLNDVDITNGNANGTLLVMGIVDEGKLDSTVVAKLPAEVKKALKLVEFIK